MTEHQRDLALVDRRGGRAGVAARDAAARVDTGAMFERVRAPRRGWVGPLVVLAGSVTAVAIGVLVAWQPPVTVGGLDTVGRPPALSSPPGVGDVAPVSTWWCPPEAVAAARSSAIGEVELVTARLSTVGEIRAWQDQPIGDPGDAAPDVDPHPQDWLQDRAADQPAVVCTFQADEFTLPGGGYRYATYIATPDGTVHPYQAMPREPTRHERGPAASTPLHEAPGSWHDRSATATVDVPDVVGMTEAEAIRVLSDHGLAVLTFTQATDDATTVGRVVAQSPGPGEVSATPPRSATTDELTIVIQVGTDAGQ